MIIAATLLATVTRARFLMGTVCEITARPAATERAFDEAARIESLLSTWRDDSELSQLNAHRAKASPELVALLRTVADLSAESGGAFNPLVRPLIDLWKTRGSGAVPDHAALADALTRVRLDNLAIENGSIELRNDARIEEGGFGKGYALDRMLAVIGDGDVVMNFGGQIAVRGRYEVAIADPRDRTRTITTVTLRDESISTSSGSEKSFTVAGRTFTHIIDPRTGEALPRRGSVSVIDKSALRADVLSTALYVMGPEDGFTWAREHGVHAVFISESGEMRETR